MTASARTSSRTSSTASLPWTALRRVFPLGRLFEDAALRHPASTVLLDRPLSLAADDRVRLSYADLAGVVDDVAARLRLTGLRERQYLAIYADSGFDLPVLGCAAARAGAVPVMLSPTLEPAAVRALLGRLGSAWLATDAPRLRRLAAEGPPRGTRVLALSGEQAASDYGDLPVTTLATPAQGQRARPVDLPPDHPALITHSSGTTGVPKLMVHTSRTLAHRLLPQRLLAWPVRGEPVLLDMSMVHSRFFNSLGIFMGYGNPLAVLAGPGLQTVRETLVAFRPTVVETAPNNFVLWEDLAGEEDAPLSSVRYYTSTFDAIHPGTVKKLLDASRHRRPYLLQLYGQSETGPLTGWLNTRRNCRRMDGRRVGYPLPGFTRVRVVAPDGRPAARGEIGRVQARTRGRVRTYLGEEERYRAQLHDGWWCVGDLGWRDRRGRLYLADREVDQVSGVDSSLSLEDIVLERLPEIAEVVIVPDGDGRPLPIVATRGDRPLEPARWATAAEGLPALRDPVQWRFGDFPRTATLKVRRLEIRELMRGGKAPRPIAPGKEPAS